MEMTTPTRATRTLALALSALAAALLGTLAGAAAAGPPAWTGPLTQQALGSGFLTRLPPTVSQALGLAKASEGTEVRQLISKSGHRVRSFNVSVARKSDLVLFSVDASSGATLAWLIGPDARLRKAVTYQAGGQAQEMAAADARAGLEREARFWSARAKKTPASGAQ
jgi:hypothetical protein